MKYLETIENNAGALSVSTEIWFIKNAQSSMHNMIAFSKKEYMKFILPGSSRSGSRVIRR